MNVQSVQRCDVRECSNAAQTLSASLLNVGCYGSSSPAIVAPSAPQRPLRALDAVSLDVTKRLDRNERVFDTRRMADRPLSWPQHVALSKSTPLAPYQVDELLASHELLLREREQLRALLDTLPANVTTIRAALNALARVLHEPPAATRRP